MEGAETEVVEAAEVVGAEAGAAVAAMGLAEEGSVVRSAVGRAEAEAHMPTKAVAGTGAA